MPYYRLFSWTKTVIITSLPIVTSFQIILGNYNGFGKMEKTAIKPY
jgi:hypothetical protein